MRQNYLTPRGTWDVQRACEILENVNSELNLLDIATIQKNIKGISSYDEVDVIQAVYNFILNKANQAIGELRVNIISKNHIFYYVWGNYIDTKYERSKDSDKFLTEEINKDKETRFELYSNNKYVAFFFDETWLSDLFSNKPHIVKYNNPEEYIREVLVPIQKKYANR